MIGERCLRAKLLKSGDAELRGYNDQIVIAKPAGPPANSELNNSGRPGGLFVFPMEVHT